PAATMPTTLDAIGPANAIAYRESPPSAATTAGMVVVTARDSKALSAISATIPRVMARYSGVNGEEPDAGATLPAGLSWLPAGVSASVCIVLLLGSGRSLPRQPPSTPGDSGLFVARL